jgi:hypothetical protein
MMMMMMMTMVVVVVVMVKSGGCNGEEEWRRRRRETGLRKEIGATGVLSWAGRTGRRPPCSGSAGGGPHSPALTTREGKVQAPDSVPQPPPAWPDKDIGPTYPRQMGTCCW